MTLNNNNKYYLSIIIFMIPIIVLSIIILSVKIKTSNLESIISSPVQKNASLCYNLTNKNQMKDTYHCIHI